MVCEQFTHSVLFAEHLSVNVLHYSRRQATRNSWDDEVYTYLRYPLWGITCTVTLRPWSMHTRAVLRHSWSASDPRSEPRRSCLSSGILWQTSDDRHLAVSLERYCGLLLMSEPRRSCLSSGILWQTSDDRHLSLLWDTVVCFWWLNQEEAVSLQGYSDRLLTTDTCLSCGILWSASDEWRKKGRDSCFSLV